MTATNVFAHIEGIHDIVDSVLAMLADDGVFISESHYLMALIETLQYDTIYHEHLRHYSLDSLEYLLEEHGLEVIHAKRIPTHGGSIRVYAARKRRADGPADRWSGSCAEERGAGPLADRLDGVSRTASCESKLALYTLLRDLKVEAARHLRRRRPVARQHADQLRRRSTTGSSTASSRSRDRTRSASTSPAR